MENKNTPQDENITSTDRPALIRIIDPQSTPTSAEEQASDDGCHFWLGCYRRGTLNPMHLMSYRYPEECFSVASDTGLAETKAVMLVDSGNTSPHYVYLEPADSCEADPYVSILKQCQPLRVGLFFSPELIPPNDSREVMLNIISKALLAVPTLREFYLMPRNAENNTKDEDINELLNTAIWLKKNLEKEAINVRIYH